LGARDGVANIDGQQFQYRRYGLRVSRRVYRSESLAAMRAAARTKALPNRGVAAIRRADAVLDISGGDSFADIYGRRRFELVSRPKLLALQLGRPLVLLPQTYGPFQTRRTRQLAAEIVRRASVVWARDPDSFERLRWLLGSAFDPERHRSGVDVAFGLPQCNPTDGLSSRVRSWVGSDHLGALVGLNVSGLLANDDASRQHFRLKVDYRRLVRQLTIRLLTAGADDVRLLLIPHVADSRSEESDVDACRALLDRLPPGCRDRVEVVDTRLTAGQVKGLVSKLDWFCGTRMHSTIAALSSGVPAAAIAYSPKTRGVFETCDQAQAVADARALTTDEALEVLWDSWVHRSDAERTLAKRLPEVLERAETQWDDILSLVLPGFRMGTSSFPDLGGDAR
jgi:colanic acid/amylovoran biosynthesis protein